MSTTILKELLHINCNTDYPTRLTIQEGNPSIFPEPVLLLTMADNENIDTDKESEANWFTKGVTVMSLEDEDKLRQLLNDRNKDAVNVVTEDKTMPKCKMTENEDCVFKTDPSIPLTACIQCGTKPMKISIPHWPDLTGEEDMMVTPQVEIRLCTPEEMAACSTTASEMTPMPKGALEAMMERKVTPVDIKWPKMTPEMIMCDPFLHDNQKLHERYREQILGNWITSGHNKFFDGESIDRWKLTLQKFNHTCNVAKDQLKCLQANKNTPEDIIDRQVRIIEMLEELAKGS